jgi:hypothetical protein
MITQTAISSLHKLAIGLGLVTAAALVALLVFSLQTTRTKKEYQDYDARVVQPERQKWQSAAKTPDVGRKIEPLPSIPVGLFAEENRLAIELAHLTFRRDTALNAAITAGILSAIMFAFHSALKKRGPIQRATDNDGAAPRRV